MFTHIVVGSNNLSAAKAFYDELLGVLGLKEGRQTGQRLFYVGHGLAFGITTPWDGGAAAPGNGGTVGFMAGSPEQVDVFHRTGLAAGGTCEGEPGLRDTAFGPVYAAYLRDPDRNKICAIHRQFSAQKADAA